MPPVQKFTTPNKCSLLYLIDEIQKLQFANLVVVWLFSAEV